MIIIRLGKNEYEQKKNIHSGYKLEFPPQQRWWHGDHGPWREERKAYSVDNLEKPMMGKEDSLLYELKIFKEVD